MGALLLSFEVYDDAGRDLQLPRILCRSTNSKKTTAFCEVNDVVNLFSLGRGREWALGDVVVVDKKTLFLLQRGIFADHLLFQVTIDE